MGLWPFSQCTHFGLACGVRNLQFQQSLSGRLKPVESFMELLVAEHRGFGCQLRVQSVSPEEDCQYREELNPFHYTFGHGHSLSSISKMCRLIHEKQTRKASINPHRVCLSQDLQNFNVTTSRTISLVIILNVPTQGLVITHKHQNRYT